MKEKKQSILIYLFLVFLSIRGFAQTNETLILTKTISNPANKYLQSHPNQRLPDDMVVQGSLINYTATLRPGSVLDTTTITYQYSFQQKQGDVHFLDASGAATNTFKADWYGKNRISVTATDGAGNIAVATDEVFVDFAARRILGGDAERLSTAAISDIDRGAIHDIAAKNKGLAYLPTDFSRGDTSSDELSKGFYQTTEPRLLLTSTGALIQVTQARRIGPNDAPPGQGLIVSRSTDHGNSWKNELLLAQNEDDLWGYSSMVEINGTIYCYVVAGHPTHQDNNLMDRGIYYFTSKDDGVTWSEKIKHQQLSDAIGFTASTSDGIPNGASPNCNILKVPNLTLDGVKAPKDMGLLLSTYAKGSIWASINGGVTWSKVANYKVYADEKENGYGIPIHLGNEISWSVLNNTADDIYMVVRRQANTGYKNEYVFSKEMTSGDLGIHFIGIYNQTLKNLNATRCHHGMRSIKDGPEQGKILFAYQGASSRHHLKLAVSKEAISGNQTIAANMFNQVYVMEDIAWGYCDIAYLTANLPHTKGIGKDAIVVIGESEPIHKKTHQIIDLKPNGKGKDERYTITAYILSMDYFNFLVAK